MANDELRAQLDDVFAARDREDMTPTIEAFSRILEQHPEDPMALYELGGAYDIDGQETVAAEYYRQAMGAGLEGRWLRQCYLQYGSTLRNMGRVEESLSLFDDGIRAFPESETLVLFKSLTLHAAGKPSEALGSVLRLIADRFPTDEVLRYEVALRGNAAYLESLDGDTPESS